MQSFIRNGKWQAGEAMQKVQAAFAKELVPSCDRWSIGTVGVLDESGFEKSGSESVGVARQYCGRLGKVENCQVGVYLVGVTPDGTCPLDQQLFLPKEWIKDKTRRRNTQVPRDIKFQSKPQLGMEMIRRTDEAGKKHLGMADYETRAWTSWHHHMALVALAHFIVTLTRRDVKDNEPDFTLDMAVRVLQSAFARDRCSEDDAFSIIEYHLRRNKAAHQSHRKSWLRKHKRIEVKPLL